MSVRDGTAAGAVVPFDEKSRDARGCVLRLSIRGFRFAAFDSRLSFRDGGAAWGRAAPRADQPVLRRPAAIPLMVR
jgi:hypothetical protein